MKKTIRENMQNLTRLISCLLVVILLALNPTVAQAQEIGNFCVWDYQSGANCTANDVRIEEVRIVDIVKPCGTSPSGELWAVFEVLVSAAGSPDRYDIGMFLALDGGSALSGDSCYHDYLPPPITVSPVYGDKNNDGIQDIDNGPWWNGEVPKLDTCGDIQTNTQVFRLTQEIHVACADIDKDGHADIDVCTSWDNNTGTNCTSVQGAIPGTGSKCSCSTVNFDFTPTAIKGATFTARSLDEPSFSAASILGVLLLGGVVLAYAGNRSQKNKVD